jgi:predicted nucleotidyltransferase
MDKVLLKKIKTVLKKHGIKRAAVFGSYARGQERKTSDIDLLVEMDDEKSLFDFIRLQLNLEKALKRKVDLAEFGYLHPFIKDSVDKELVPVL